jgi:hypothetical protein
MKAGLCGEGGRNCPSATLIVASILLKTVYIKHPFNNYE